MKKTHMIDTILHAACGRRMLLGCHGQIATTLRWPRVTCLGCLKKRRRMHS